MTIYAVLRQTPHQSFLWGTFDSVDKAYEFIEKHEAKFDGFYIAETQLNAD